MDKKMAILAVLIVLVIVLDIGLIITRKKSIHQNIVSYECKRIDNWTEFGYLGINNEDLGKYKREYDYIFKIKDNKNLVQSEMKEIFSFTNLFGYSILSLELEGFKEELDEENLTKIYISSSYIPIDFKMFSSDEKAVEKYITQLEKDGYNCSR